MFRTSLLLIAVVASALSFVAVNAEEDVCTTTFRPIIFCESKDGTPCGDLKRRGINADNCEETLVIKVKIRNSSTEFAATLNSQTVEFTGPGFTNTEGQELEYVYGNEALRVPKKTSAGDGELVREYEKTVDLCKMSFNVQFNARFWVNQFATSCGMSKIKTFEPVPFCSMESKIECKIPSLGGLPCGEEPEEQCGPKTINYVYSMCNHNPNGEITAWKNQITAKIRNDKLELPGTSSSLVAETGGCTTIIEKEIAWTVDTCEKQLPFASLMIKASPDTDDIQNCFAYTYMRNPFEEDDEEDKDEKEKDEKEKDEKEKDEKEKDEKEKDDKDKEEKEKDEKEKDDKDHDKEEKDDKDDQKDKDEKDDKKEKDDKDHDKKEFEVRRNMRGSRQ